MPTYNFAAMSTHATHEPTGTCHLSARKAKNEDGPVFTTLLGVGSQPQVGKITHHVRCSLTNPTGDHEERCRMDAVLLRVTTSTCLATYGVVRIADVGDSRQTVVVPVNLSYPNRETTVVPVRVYETA